ncbi:electron transfer flavoprotein subunit beta/FixA family protein [Pseudarthrobacter sp. lyk4-40-TYG-27]|jgi:electron transfer flavoprotein beta subunit|uniref:electron transfer flavoprotein subunit beta/FixA family protein n=1 Tax=Pseudarthrobacter sp. lyk4-40-TYG-27 TaxID=3040305 RepID=UPI002552B929|nr:electron transfer flavoprotein subunit beta/FixA family protein [Pseudarthrobacter sp. lyk4-40-TYG-27]
MRIVVLIKEVPDTYGPRMLDLETGLAARSASARVPDEVGERALECALRYAEQNAGTEVIALTMGPQLAAGTIRKALAMGAARGIHVCDDGLVGADLTLTAQVLAAAITRVGFDLVIAGNLSTDGAGGVIPAMLAELLDAPALTALTTLEIQADRISCMRQSEGETQEVSAALPAIASVTESLPDPRLPGFKGIMAAKKKSIETISLPDLGLDPEDPSAPRSVVLAVAERPTRSAGTKIVDEGDAGRQLADYLIGNRLV